MDRTKNPAPIRFPYGDGRFEVSERGVYFHGKGKDGEPSAPLWLCSALRITAQTRDDNNAEWGRLLEWRDNDGHEHQWAMPMKLLESDGSEVRRHLANHGVNIAHALNARNLLASYLKICPVTDRVRCVDRLGWHEGVFVTPTETIGKAVERVVFQNRHGLDPMASAAGTPAQWRDTVGRLASGNSRLIFVISAAFAGPLLGIVGESSGGIHLRGGSSTGKSTALKVAASVYGQPSRYLRNWRSTINGLEALAALHNDSMLILDEIGQVDPNAVGDAAYMLANGLGKARANRNGHAKAAQQWQLIFLSAGEESLSALMERVGKKATAGQETRLAEIEADAGAGLGLFDELHEHASPAILANALAEATASAYGSVGKAWLEHLATEKGQLFALLTKRMADFVQLVAPAGAHGQALRVARRFALVAAAGELATEYGLTGWTEGEANQAASICFTSWLNGFGDVGSRESRAIVAQARGFLEKHGASRFEYLKATDDERILNRAGFFRTDDAGDREYLFPEQSFHDYICYGYPKKVVVEALRKSGMLIPDKHGGPTQVMRLPGLDLPPTCRTNLKWRSPSNHGE